MALIDDYIVAAGAGVITTTLIILFVLLARYRQLVNESTKSSQLAKNVWDSMNARLTTMDARIIDIMAKVEIYSTRTGSRPIRGSVISDALKAPVRAPVEEPQFTAALRPAAEPSTILETETQILRSLAQGPRTSNQIREIIGKSREHTARLMKSLFDHGLVVRNDRNKPYVYEITENGRRHLTES